MSATPVQGGYGSGDTDGGAPVKVGGKYNVTLPTFTDGQRGDAQITLNGALLVSPPSTASDGVTGVAAAFTSTSSSVARALAAGSYLFNGTSWDRQRGNVDTAALVTAAGATTTQTTADQTNYNGRGVIVVLDTTVIGTGSVTLTIQGKDAASGKYYTLLAGAAVVTNATNVYTVYPAAPATANVSANSPLPRVWRIQVTANNANPATYTVGASVIV